MNKSVEFKKAQQKLQSALITNDYDTAKQALAEGARADREFEDYAVKTGDRIFVYSKEPLDCAIAYAKFPLFALMIDSGAPIHGIYKNLGSPLMTAAHCGNRDCLYALIQLGAHINAKNCSGTTALMVAAMYGKMACLQELIAHGADVEVTTNDGFTALMCASLASGDYGCPEGAFALMPVNDHETDEAIRKVQADVGTSKIDYTPFWESIAQYRKKLPAIALAALRSSEKHEPHMRIVAEYLFGELKPNSQIGDT